MKLSRLWMWGFASAGIPLLVVFAQVIPQAQVQYSFTISASQPWTDTGVNLSSDDVLTFSAETRSGANCSPAGSSGSSGLEMLPLPDVSPGALIAKTSESGAAVLIGTNRKLQADSPGHLFLGINYAGKSECVFTVKLQIAHVQEPAKQDTTPPRNVRDQLSSAAKVWLHGQFGSSSAKAEGSTAVAEAGANGMSASASGAASGLKLPTAILDADFRKNIDGLPRRVHDHLGNPGDVVNFIIVGSQDRVQAALQAADWHLADVDSKEAGFKAIMNTYEKKDYLEMPMSHLYLFDRTQDFGYEQAQAYSVAASRHHFRLWRAPFAWNNETVWVGAGTHDIGFEKDIRTGKLTHKIDPAVDGERENIAEGLEKSGRTKGITYYLPPNPVQEAKNASGGSYHSDGRLLVVFLK